MADTKQCSHCSGSGQVTLATTSQMVVTCDRCDGEGYLYICTGCAGGVRPTDGDCIYGKHLCYTCRQKAVD